MERWVLNLRFFSLRLHHWLHSDDMRAPHDHPWWFLTLCLWGRYVDVSDAGHDVVSPGSVRFRRAEHRHSVKVERSTWTLLVTGPERRTWGFWVKGKFRKRNKYFYELWAYSVTRRGPAGCAVLGRRRFPRLRQRGRASANSRLVAR